MKLCQYEDLRKLNQALSSFSKNEVPIVSVDQLVVDGKIQYFVLTNPKYELKKLKESINSESLYSSMAKDWVIKEIDKIFFHFSNTS